ncbi:MAG: TPM domain-containing protein [Methylococcales bacterium]|nr:TPM domain-containing protein [Methylococcales bacterium]
MRCPYCKSPVTEAGFPSCQRCGISLEKVTRLFGVIPPIVAGLSDNAGVLSEPARRRIKVAANEISISFPQTNFSVVTAKLPADTSLGVFAFWIFNEGGVARELDRGQNNYDILLTIAPASGRASLMVGYGLETYIDEAQLAEVIETARPALEQGQYARAIEQIISNFKEALTEIVANLESTHGVAPVVTSKSSAIEITPTDF